MIDIPVKNIYIHQLLDESIEQFLKGVVLPPGFHYIVENLYDSDIEALENNIKELLNKSFNDPFESVPAGSKYNLCKNFEYNINIKELNNGNRDSAYINGLNPIRTLPTMGIVLYGAKFINCNNKIYWMNHEIAGTRLSRQKILHPDIIAEYSIEEDYEY